MGIATCIHSVSSLHPSCPSCVFASNAWLDVHYDPVASLYTFSDCMGKLQSASCHDNKLVQGILIERTYQVHTTFKLAVHCSLVIQLW